PPPLPTPPETGDPREPLFVLRCRGNVRGNREVVPRPDRPDELLDRVRRRPAALFLPTRSREDLVRAVLGLLHVRLIERVDPEQSAGEGGRELPPEHFRAEVERVGNFEPRDGMTGPLELAELRRCIGVGGGPPDADEKTVLPPPPRRPERGPLPPPRTPH